MAVHPIAGPAGKRNQPPLAHQTMEDCSGLVDAGLAMAIPAMLAKGGNQPARFFYIMLGAAFAMALWLFAWHTKTLEISANGQGVRMTSVLGWRDVPWEMIRSVEDQQIFTT